METQPAQEYDVRLNRRPRILSADDDEVLGQLLHLVYGDAYDLVHATTMSETLSLLASCGFDLLILDLDFPDGDGLQILRELRRGHLRRPGAILMMSANPDQHIMERSHDLGALAYLNKPVDLPLLSEAIHIALTRRGAREAGRAVRGGEKRWRA